MSKNFPLRLDPENLGNLEKASKKTRLSMADLARLALERGLPILLAQLDAEVKVARIALPPRVIEEAKAAKMRERFAKGGL